MRLLRKRDAERFWSKVDQTPGQGPNGDCWMWTAGRNNNGYGKFCLAGSTLGAHRVAFCLNGGVQKLGLLVMHSCDVKLCCNPAHLRLGTAADNVRDAYAKGLIRRPSRTVPLTDAELLRLKDEYDHGLSKKVLCKKWQLAPTTLTRLLERAAIAAAAAATTSQADESATREERSDPG